MTFDRPETDTEPDDTPWLLRDHAAREEVRQATETVASLVETTLGPNGSEKLIQTLDPQGDPEDVVATRANEILTAIERGDGFNHPVSALFVDAVDSMHRALGDGTTSAMVLTSALVSNAIDLIKRGLHPTNVAVGYALAATRAGETLDALTREVGADDRDVLTAVARTAMTADLGRKFQERGAEMAADAVRELANAGEGPELDTDRVKIIAAEGAPTEFHRGVVVRQRPGPLDKYETESFKFRPSKAVPTPIPDATVAVVDRDLTPGDVASSFGDKRSGIQVDTREQLNAYATERDERRTVMADHIASQGVDVLVSQAELDEDIVDALRDRGVSVVDDVRRPLSDIDQVARATGANIVSYVDDLGSNDLGQAGRVVQQLTDDEVWTFFDECDGSAFTVTADAATPTDADRRERSLRAAIEATAMAVMDGEVVPGAGAPAMAVAADLRGYAPSESGREQLAIGAFADACEEIVDALAENAGGDPLDARTALRAAHASDASSHGIDATTGRPMDAWDAGVVEPRRVFSQALETARLAAEQLVTIDAILYPNVDFDTYSPETEYD